LRQTLAAFNEGRAAKNQPTLDVWEKGMLQTKIQAGFDRLILNLLPSVRDFLQMVLADGAGLAAKADISKFLERSVSQFGRRSTEGQLRRCCAELVLLGAHLASPYQRANNFISEIEVWTLVGSQLVLVGCESKRAWKVARQSLALVEVAIWTAMKGLLAEIPSRKNYVQGSALVDAFVYRERITHVAGYLAAAYLWGRHFGEALDAGTALMEFWRVNQNQMLLWGEAAIPSFLAMGWALDDVAPQRALEQLTCDLIRAICSANKSQVTERGQVLGHMAGLADPYQGLQG
jgi:hypothetical protein